MSNAIDAARFFVRLASQEEEPTFLSHLHVQKLLYYAQGWHIAFKGEPLFRGRIEAWPHGPVACDVWPYFKQYGAQPIPATEGQGGQLTCEEESFLRSIWAAYRGFSAWRLRDMTHKEQPWREARGHFPAHEHSNFEISLESMQHFFQDQYHRRAFPGLEFDKLQQAEREAKAGLRVSFDEVFAGLE
jgi:uncharacterized phage-associated protein